MLRNILAGAVGVAIAVMIVFLADELSHTMYPLPDGLDPSDPEALGAYIATLPLGAFLMVMGGWALATFVGSVIAHKIAAKIGNAKVWIYPLVVGGFVFVAAAVTLVMIPHPHWFTAVSLVAILASTWLAWRVAVATIASRAAA